MFFILAGVVLSSEANNLKCDLLSGRPNSCQSVPGCSYNYETHLCTFEYSRFLRNEDMEAVDNAATSKKKFSRCYTEYDENGCGKCVPREAGVKCGFCLSHGVCLEGNEGGPDFFTCSEEDWQFNKTRCDKVTCGAATSQEKCRQPCHWSKTRKQCVMASRFTQKTAEENKLDEESARTNYFYVVSAASVGVVVVVAIAAAFIFRNKSSYTPLKANYNLDDLPRAY